MKQSRIASTLVTTLVVVSLLKASRSATHADPMKGEFGGQARPNDRLLAATVQPLDSTEEFFEVRSRVESTAARRPPRGNVQFFLHPTFLKDRPIVADSSSGIAELVLHAYDTFTVDAYTDYGTVKLELNLASLPDAPKRFLEA